MVALALGLVIWPPIDRQATVERHNVKLTDFNPGRPIQVGNGEFAYNADLTGMQTFTPFNTLSQWGWYSAPLPPGLSVSDYQFQPLPTHGREVPYAIPDPKNPEVSRWLAANPHRLNLGRIGLVIKKKNGQPARPEELVGATQLLDLWSGVLTSRFRLEGVPVTVKTACHPSSDTVAFEVISELVRTGQIYAFVASPGDDQRYFADYVGNWNAPVTVNIETDVSHGISRLHHKYGNSVFTISLKSDKALKVEPEMPVQEDLQILSARYGAGKKWLDVTDLARKRIIENQLHLRVNSELGPDPNPGVGKVLQVSYQLANTVQVRQAKENDLLLIAPSEMDGRHVIRPINKSSNLSFSCGFSKDKQTSESEVSSRDVFRVSREMWAQYWQSGGFIDLSGSTDPRWKELERRIILSQYLMKVNTGGSLPPQESGLQNNGWYGRFHMEMTWWHGAHWALWDRHSELDKYHNIYNVLQPNARATAQRQGFKGARWQKCVGPNGVEWPDVIHALLSWQQPHPIYFAELDYRKNPSKKTLEKWWPIIKDTADFMASNVYLNPTTNTYDLGPPIYVVSENTDPMKTRNPAFELGYWRLGLRLALKWRERLSLPQDPEWSKVLSGLSPLPVKEGVYVLHEDVEDMWTKFNFEHPALVGTYGMLPGDGVDRATMVRTLKKVQESWEFNRVWGWDFPMLAMCAARLGQPELAINFLLHPSQNFQFDDVGLATGGPFPYFPSNGGLLFAVAMMSAGWESGPSGLAPGFPKDGKWKVRFERLQKAL